MPASRSASSSQLFTERMTLSLAGMPAGKSAWSRVSRLTLRSQGALERLERLVLPTVVPLVRLARVRRRWFGARLRVALVEPADFAERAWLDARRSRRATIERRPIGYSSPTRNACSITSRCGAHPTRRLQAGPPLPSRARVTIGEHWPRRGDYSRDFFFAGAEISGRAGPPV